MRWLFSLIVEKTIYVMDATGPWWEQEWLRAIQSAVGK
jgi:hypothetical protein